MDTIAEEIVILAPTLAPDNEVPQEMFRALIGWANSQWAIDVRNSVITDTVEDHLKALAACQMIIASRPNFTPTNPITEIEDSTSLDALKIRPETAYIAREVTKAGGTWRFAKVDLRNVLAFQPLVTVDNIGDSPVQSDMSDGQLYQICFPPCRPIAPDEVTVEGNEAGYRITTLNPNIRVFPWHLLPFPAEIPQPAYNIQYPDVTLPFQVGLVPFALVRVPNYLQIVRYRERFFVRDGYTRVARFLCQGIHIVPCMFIEAPSVQLLGWRQGMLDLPLLLGPHPPRLNDYWDDEVSCSGVRQPFRYVYTINSAMTPTPR